MPSSGLLSRVKPHTMTGGMSLANRITLGRALLIPAIVVLALTEHRIAAAVLFFVVSAGDVLDGLVARARGEVTTLGKALDPAVDKILYLSVIAALASQGDVPLWLAVLFAVPHVGLAVGAVVLHASVRVVQGARWPGKAAAVLTFASVLALFLPLPDVVGGAACVALMVAVGLSYVAAVDYAVSGVRTRRVLRSRGQETLRER